MSFAEKFFNKSKKEEIKNPEEENKNKQEEQEKDFESQEEIKQKELLMENLDKAQEALDNIGGEEGLKNSMEELGSEKIGSIFSVDRIKKLSQKTMEVIGYAAVSPAFASVTYLFAKLYNSSNSGEPVNPLIIAGITALSVALVEISAIRSANKEKKEKEFGMRVEA